MLASVLTLAAVAAPVSAAAAPISSADRPWMTSLRAAPPATRAAAVLAKMNQTEKIAMLHGVHLGYVGNVLGNTRLGIPQLNLNDGPQGFRGIKGTSTQWPSALAVAASWDVENTGAWGTGMGKEFFQKGANVQLGPGACLARVPVNGRNFEYVSGEDPFLGYTLIAPVIKGIQSQGVIANAKHWINNNQEVCTLLCGAACCVLMLCLLCSLLPALSTDQPRRRVRERRRAHRARDVLPAVRGRSERRPRQHHVLLQ